MKVIDFEGTIPLSIIKVYNKIVWTNFGDYFTFILDGKFDNTNPLLLAIVLRPDMFSIPWNDLLEISVTGREHEFQIYKDYFNLGWGTIANDLQISQIISDIDYSNWLTNEYIYNIPIYTSEILNVSGDRFQEDGMDIKVKLRNNHYVAINIKKNIAIVTLTI
jgi:hypothetical protein